MVVGVGVERALGLGLKPVLWPLWLEEREVWEAAMPTWVMMEEVEEEEAADDEGEEMKHQVKLGG